MSETEGILFWSGCFLCVLINAIFTVYNLKLYTEYVKDKLQDKRRKTNDGGGADVG